MANELIGILGTSTSGGPPPLQTRRKFDRSDRILMRALADAPALHIIISRAQKRGVGSVKYYMFEEDYFVQSGTLKGCDVNGNDAALTTSTQYVYVVGASGEKAKSFLRPGDVIHVPAWQPNQTNQTGVGGTTDGTAYIAGEDMIVREIVSDYVVKVDRGGGAGTQPGNVTAASGDTLNWELKGPVLPDASSSPEGRADSLEEDYNYREIKRVSWDVSGRNLREDMYGEPDIQRLARKHRTQLFRFLERSFWTGHRYITYGANGLEESHTGGFFEFVADTSPDHSRLSTYDASADLVSGDGSQRVWLVNNNFNLSSWSRFLERGFKYGSRNKVLFAGRGLLVKLEDLLRPYYGSFDWDVDSFGFGIVRARSSFGELPIVVEQEFSEGAAAYDYWCAIADMDYLWYVYGAGPCAVKGCGNRNSDVHVHKEIQANDEDHRKDELYVDYGWDQRFRKAHAFMIWDGS